EVACGEVVADVGGALIAAGEPGVDDQVAAALDLRRLDQAVDLDVLGGLDVEAVLDAAMDDDRAVEVDVAGGEADGVADGEHLLDRGGPLGADAQAGCGGDDIAAVTLHDGLVEAGGERLAGEGGDGLAGDVAAGLAGRGQEVSAEDFT